MNGPQNELDQKNLLLAVVLSAGVLMMWQMVNPPAPVQKAPPSTTAGKTSTAPSTSKIQGGTPSLAKAITSSADKSAPTAPKISRSVLATLDKPERNALKLTNVDGQISSWILTEEQYRQRSDDGQSSPFAFVDEPQGKLERSLFLPPTIGLNLAGKPAMGAYTLISSKAQEASLGWTDPVTGVKVTRSYRLDADNYRVNVVVKLENSGSTPVPYDLTATFPAFQDDSQSEGSMFMPPIYVYESLCRRNEDFERLTAVNIRDNIEDKDPNSFSDNIQWGGIGNRYFMTGLITDAKTIERCTAQAEKVSNASGFTRVETRLDLVGGEIQAGQSVQRSFTIYGGPKKLSALHSQNVNLGEAIDFGIFSVICIPMLWLMRFFFEFMPNWGVAIIILTVLVKILTLPLTVKQYRSMAGMKKIQPKMKALQDKYADDKVRMQQELMKLYRENKVNPLSGCLPMLMMMPIYFALYRTIFSAVELYQAPFVGWITDLSQQDAFYITPVLLGVLMMVQMRLNPSAGDQTQQKVLMYVMPIMFTAMMLFLPSGLVLYILVNTVLGICQQYWIYSKTDITAAPAKA